MLTTFDELATANDVHNTVSKHRSRRRLTPTNRKERAAHLREQLKHVTRHWVTILTLAIALIGGVPGLIAIWTELTRPALLDVRISFDKEHSACAFIRSSIKPFDGQLAVFLYSLNIAGKGQAPLYIREVSVYVRSRGQWIKGTQFHPTKTPFARIDTVQLYALNISIDNPARPFERAGVLLMGWKDFDSPGKALALGEPLDRIHTPGYAARFPIDLSAYSDCDRLKIEVTDYLGNRYEEVAGREFFKPRFTRFAFEQLATEIVRPSLPSTN